MLPDRHGAAEHARAVLALLAVHDDRAARVQHGLGSCEGVIQVFRA